MSLLRRPPRLDAYRNAVQRARAYLHCDPRRALHCLASGTLNVRQSRWVGLSPSTKPGSPVELSTGEISTHVISKLGKGSVDGARIRVLYHSDFEASVTAPGWTLVTEANLQPMEAWTTSCPRAAMRKGLYLIEFDFSGVDAAARQIFGRLPGHFVRQSDWLLRSQVVSHSEDRGSRSMNHLVLCGDKELTARQGVRAH